MTDNLDTAQVLALARKSGRLLASHPRLKPANLQDAFHLQRQVTRALGWTQCGWKAGATSPTAQAVLGLEEPYVAPLFAERLFRSGDHIATEASHSRIVEPEIAFVMRVSLPLRDQPYSTAEVLDAVLSVHPALELVNPRLPKGLKEPVEWTIADGGVNDALVLGAGTAPLAAGEYAAIHARARVNGAWTTSGVGANVLGGPEHVLTWLANHLRERAISLAKGHIVTTGLLTDLIHCERRDVVEADFGAIGCVSVRL